MFAKKNKLTNICGLDIYNKSKKECLDEIFSRDKVHIISGNPEVLYTSLNDDKLYNEFKSKNSLIIPDGVGVKVAAKMKGMSIAEKIPGVELMVDIIERCSKTNTSVYLLGATDKSLDLCVNKLKKDFPNTNIVGMRNGFFSEDDTNNIVQEIIDSKAEVLFVALGCPKQETFIVSNFNILPCKILMGVGGSFDVIGGLKNRAPKIMISLGLEWLYRVILEPFRIKRLLVIPKFLIKSLTYKSKKGL